MRKNTIVKKCLAVLLVILLCSFPVSMHAVNTASEAAIPAEEKISDTLYAEFARLEEKSVDSSAEKIPVWVWYKDINQTQVDNVVKARTDLTAENTAVDFEMPSLSLIEDLKNGAKGGQTQMEAYLARTEQARALEAQRTDTLIMTRREVSREKYNAESAEIIEEINLAEEDIIFKSQYAPAIITEMTQAQIEQAAEDESIDMLDFYNQAQEVECTIEQDIEKMTSVKQTLGLDKVYNNTGLTGQNVKVGMFEIGPPIPNSEIVFTTVGTGWEQRDHATNSARAIASSKVGIAPNVTLYATDANLANIESMLTLGVRVINASFGWLYDSTVPYSVHDKWFDHISSQHNVLLVCSAGNYKFDSVTHTYIPRPIYSPAMAYNCVAVGAYDEKKTGKNYTDDALYIYSCHDNKGGCEKPDIIAPASVLGGGTSTSAPIVTGIVALLLELKPSLAYQPQATKAILLASCQRKVTNPTGVAAETMAQGLTARQGAGAVDAWNAICIISQEQYGCGEFSGTEERRNFIQPKYGASNMNVSVAWLRENKSSGTHVPQTNVTVGTQHNLDLQVYRNGTLVGSSAKENSSTEMAYFPLSTTSDKYQIRTYKSSAATGTVRYGYAWSTDKMTYKPRLMTSTYTPTDGMFYIRHKNGQYLTVNESTGAVSQSAFTGNRNQQWIMDKASNTRFTVKTRSLTYPGSLSRASNGNAIIDQIGDYLAYFDLYSAAGAYAIGHFDAGDTSSQYLQQINGLFGWSGGGAPTNFQWYTEKIGYQKGDVNIDGALATADILLMQQYIAKTIILNDDQLYLADMNSDGAVTLMDITILQNILALAG